jgi:hypothetical protein
MAACCELHDFQDFVRHEDFFKPCPRHAAAPQRESQLNLWDVTAQRACCGLCVTEQPFHSVLQVRGGAGDAWARGPVIWREARASRALGPQGPVGAVIGG